MTVKEIRTRLESYINDVYTTLQNTSQDNSDYWKLNLELSHSIRIAFKVGFNVMLINGKYCVI